MRAISNPNQKSWPPSVSHGACPTSTSELPTSFHSTSIWNVNDSSQLPWWESEVWIESEAKVPEPKDFDNFGRFRGVSRRRLDLSTVSPNRWTNFIQWNPKSGCNPHFCWFNMVQSIQSYFFKWFHSAIWSPTGPQTAMLSPSHLSCSQIKVDEDPIDLHGFCDESWNDCRTTCQWTTTPLQLLHLYMIVYVYVHKV